MLLIIIIIIIVRLWCELGMHLPWCRCGDQGTSFESWFSPPQWVPEIHSSGQALKHCYLWATSLLLSLLFGRTAVHCSSREIYFTIWSYVSHGFSLFTEWIVGTMVDFRFLEFPNQTYTSYPYGVFSQSFSCGSDRLAVPGLTCPNFPTLFSVTDFGSVLLMFWSTISKSLRVRSWGSTWRSEK